MFQCEAWIDLMNKLQSVTTLHHLYRYTISCLMHHRSFTSYSSKIMVCDINIRYSLFTRLTMQNSFIKLSKEAYSCIASTLLKCLSAARSEDFVEKTRSERWSVLAVVSVVGLRILIMEPCHSYICLFCDANHVNV